MTARHRKYLFVYDSFQSDFIRIKHDIGIPGYHTPIFGKTSVYIVYAVKISNDNIIIWR